MDSDSIRIRIFENKGKIHLYKIEGTLADSDNYLSKNFPDHKIITFTTENLLKMIHDNSNIFTRKYTMQNIDFYGALNDHDKNIIDALVLQFNSNKPEIIMTLLYYLHDKKLIISSITFFDIDNSTLIVLHKSGIIEIKYYDHRSNLEQSSKKIQKITEKFFEQNGIDIKENNEFEVVKDE